MLKAMNYLMMTYPFRQEMLFSSVAFACGAKKVLVLLATPHPAWLP